MSPSEQLFCWKFGQVEFDESCLELRLAGSPVSIERKPADLLSLLLRHAGEVVTKEELLAAVWPGRIVVDAALTNAIGKLRRALGEDGKALVVVPRTGYRILGKVSRQQVAVRSPPSVLKVGDLVPRRPGFRIEQRLGRNQDREVWRATQVGTQVARVFKFSTTGNSLAALKREVTIYRLLRDALGPREEFARLVDWDFTEAPYFLELEFGGESLDVWLSQRLAEIDRAARLVLLADIADAVASAHEVGVLHKDLKPSNILVSDETGSWRIRIADFGCGRVMEPDRLDSLGITQIPHTQQVQDGEEFGTLRYLAPEILRGESPSISSDIYALGVIAYQLIVGDFRRDFSAGWERGIDDPLLRADIASFANGDPRRRPVSARIVASRARSLQMRRRKQLIQQVSWIATVIVLVAAGTAGPVYYAAQARRQAISSAEQSLVSRFRANPAAQAQLLTLMADANTDGGNRAAAEVQFETAVRLLEGMFGSNARQVLDLRLRQAANLFEMGNESRSEQVLAPVLHAADHGRVPAQLRVSSWLLAARSAQRRGDSAMRLLYLRRARNYLAGLQAPDPILVIRVSSALKDASTGNPP